MAIKKQNERMDIPINPDDDPAVEAALGNSSQRRDGVYDRIARARKLTDAQRKKLARDAARNKVTYDLPVELSDQIEMMAKDVYHCPPSHLVTLLMRQGMKAIALGELNIYNRQIASRVPRYKYFLDLEIEEDGWKPKK